MDFVHVEPGSVAGDNDFMGLGCQVLAGLILETETGCFELGRVVVIIVVSRVSRVIETVSHGDIWALLVVVVVVIVVIVVGIIGIVWTKVGNVYRSDGVELAAFAGGTVRDDGDEF